MIDRDSRNRLALALRQLASGLMTNDEFDDKAVATFIDRTDDPALAELSAFGWLHYSDIYKYRLRGRRALSNEQRTDIARAVLFLKTNQEYVHGDSLRSDTLLGTPALLGCTITVILAAGIGVYSHFALDTFGLGFGVVIGLAFLGLCLTNGLLTTNDRWRKWGEHIPLEDTSCPVVESPAAADEQYRFWPFANMPEYEMALATPPFLCERQSRSP